MVEHLQQFFLRSFFQLAAEQFSEMLSKAWRNFCCFDCAPQQFLERRRFPVRNSTRDDQVKKTQVRRDVVRESVRRDPPADVHANRAQLFLRVSGFNPNSRFPSHALGGDSKLGRSANHGLFQHAHVPNYVPPDFAQVQDGIAHNLARAMISDVAAAAGLIKLHAYLPQDVLAYEQMLPLSVSALGDHMRMLAKEHNILKGIRFSRSDNALLERVRFRVA